MNDCEQHSDVEIIQLALKEPDIFVCLYNKYEAQLLRYIHRITKISNHDAEDVLQDAFVKIWRNINNFDQEMKFSTWAYRIVHNETISFWRKKSNENIDVPLSEALGEFTEEEEDSLEFQAARIQETLAEMKEDYRVILVLRFFEKLSYDEISDVLKIPIGTVATRINRAKKTFLTVSKVQNIDFF